MTTTIARLALAVVLCVPIGTLTSAAAERTTPQRMPFVQDRQISDERITESSGLAASARFEDVLFTINDSGGCACVYAVDRAGRVAAALTLAGAVNEDWEALAPAVHDGSPVVWVGDIGDNLTSRENVDVYRFAEPMALDDQEVAAQRFRLTYEDGPHDAEALLVDPGSQRLYVVTKSRSGGGIYAAPATLDEDEVNVLTLVRPAPRGVTDGAIAVDPQSRSGARLALITYGPLFVGDGWEAPLRPFVPPARLRGESAAWAAGSNRQLFLGSEGDFSPVFLVQLPQAEGSATASSAPTPPAPAGSPEPAPLTSSSGSSSLWPLAAAIAAGLSIVAVGATLVRRRWRDRP
jgi:hypothetical protein